VKRQATGRGPQLAGRVDFARVWVAGLWLLTVVALAAVGVEDRSRWPYLTPVEVVLAFLVVCALRGVTIRSIRDGVRVQPVQAAAGLFAAVALGAALAAVPRVARATSASLRGPTYPLALADLEPLGAEGSVEALAAASRLIPAGDIFTVVYGDQYPVPLLFQFWLMPQRTFIWSVRGAAWVILYNEPLPAGLRVRRKILIAPGVYAVEARQ
jgi:hypothetical protein